MENVESKKLDSLLISEIYLSIQGESSYTGMPCIFVRLTGCDLRCAYCDSAFAFTGGNRISLDAIFQKINALRCSLVEVTGGEPLLQKAVFPFMRQLCDQGKTVLLETSGAHDISGVDPRVIRMVDLKCPSSGESQRNLISNLNQLRLTDQIKFVIGSKEDFEWAKKQIQHDSLRQKVHCILFSPTFKTAAVDGQIKGHDGLDPKLLAEWILKENLSVRLQLQIHKYIWDPLQRGV